MRLMAVLCLTPTVVFGCEAVPLIWAPSSDKADPLYRFINNERVGFIDQTGRVIIAPALELSFGSEQAFYSGLLSLGVSSGPFLNTKGEKVLDNGFYRIWNFSEGLAAALESPESNWGYIDTAGKFVIRPQFPPYPDGLVTNFAEGLAAVEVDGKLGYIDRTGAFVIARQFIAGTSFENGIARVVLEGPCAYWDYEHAGPCSHVDYAPSTGPQEHRKRAGLPLCRWKFIDRKGVPIINTAFEAALPFREDLAAVKVGDLWGFIDKRGRYVIAPAYKSVHSFSNGLALVTTGKQSGFIDKSGVLRIPAEFKGSASFYEGLAAISHPDGGIVYINTDGEQVIAERFAMGTRFFHGLAHVKIRNASSPDAAAFAYIDKTGKRVLAYEY
jgi:hypothetical protein